MIPLLVIGYGNELRSDDGVGPATARAVADRGLDGVEALALHQLTPDLADLLPKANRVVFVDSLPDPDRGEVRLRPLEPSGAAYSLGHTSDPEYLLGLTHALNGSCPSSWLLTIPVACLDFGEQLTPMAKRGLESAVLLIQQLAARTKSPQEIHSHA